MKVLLFGATGMVGQGVLRECLLAPDVSEVRTVGRSATPQRDPKLSGVVHADLMDCAAIADDLRGFDACFFCLGVSSFRMSEADYTRLTYDLTLAIAKLLAQLNPGMTFTYVSGSGTDSTERGRSMWARVKGRTENALLRLPFRSAYLFRPGVIVPLDGIRSKTRAYQSIYWILKPVLSLAKALFPKQVATTRSVGLAMLEVVRKQPPGRHIEAADIEALSLAATRPD
ncbi:epimerase [Paraburkholderia sp.]|uniref:epimerase n=1 Tax=Paraburkholderia sp. TaxID=1926495 RepID=UPI002399A1D5|nr:epimerase [Paraburkholderia sp.]MDE1179274.1 epimerase [Paraburkholderia sp.]